MRICLIFVITKEFILSNKKLLLPKSEGYVTPNNEHLVEFKNIVGWTTMDLAKVAGIQSKHLRGLFQEKNYLKGRVIDFYVWRFWLESFKFVEPLKLKPKFPVIREVIFESEKLWEQPTIEEFSYIAKRTGHSADTIAKKIGMPVKLINSFIENPKGGVFSISYDKWMGFLNEYGYGSLGSLLALPIADFHPACLEVLPNYEPPRAVQLRRFIAWTGYSNAELEYHFGLAANKLGYFMSNRSTRSTDATLTEKIFSRDGWVAPFSRELRAVVNVKRVDPGLVAKMLKMSKSEVYTCLKSPTSSRLNVTQDDWFAFLDKIGVLSASDVNSVLGKESNVHHVPYACWRMMLSAFNVSEHQMLERK